MGRVVVAPSTAPGRAALAILRVSGDGVLAAVEGLVEPMSAGPWRARRARRVRLRDAAGIIDDGVAVFYAGPRSYTGEDLLELCCHGNPLIVQRVLAACGQRGIRLAEPGAFTRRAVENGKLDLVAAEAIDQVVRATSPAGLEVGRQGLDGRLTGWLSALRDELVQITAELEARLDYPEDALVFQTDAQIQARLGALADRCDAVASTHEVGSVLVEGARVALVGAVNAGKSSLFNRLLGRARALVHDQPGTTRDVVEGRAMIGGLELTLLDTAGERHTDDPVEAAGLALARELVADAQLLLVVLRAGPSAPDEAERRILARTARQPRLVVVNGIDRPDACPVPSGWWGTSAHTGAGIDVLRDAIVEALTGSHPADGTLIASARQRDLLWAVAEALRLGAEGLVVAGVAVAADAVTEGLEHLDALTGADTREDVLDALFARFCIGK